MAANDKWRFAIGTTSRVPGQRNTVKVEMDVEGSVANFSYVPAHYLILDYDNVPFDYVYAKMWIHSGASSWTMQSTESGWHVYTSLIYDFNSLLKVAEKLGADPAWLRIGEKRGYLFLADKAPVPLPWPVERMVIARDAKRTHSNSHAVLPHS